MTDDNTKPNAKTQSIPSSVNPDAEPVSDGGETDRVSLDLKAAVQIAQILEMHSEYTEGEPDQTAPDVAAYFAEAIRDQLPEFHQGIGPDYYCRLAGASFEAQEMHGDDLCPWCGRPVEPVENQE